MSNRGQMLLRTSSNGLASCCCQCLIKRYRSSLSSSKKCYYEVLEISPDASKAEIRDAYVAKTKKIHPDRNISNPELHDRFVELNEAYSILKNEEKRSLYDQSKLNPSPRIYETGARPDNPFGSQRYRTDNGGGFEEFVGAEEYTTTFRDFKFANQQRRTEQKMANKYIIGVLMAFMFFGSGTAFWHVKYVRDICKVHEDKVHTESSDFYDTVREKARMNGPQKQLQLLASSQEPTVIPQKTDLPAVAIT